MKPGSIPAITSPRTFPLAASMIFSRKKRRFILSASVAFLLAAVTGPLRGASGTWIGGTNVWTNDANWTVAPFPNGAADVATFDNTALSLTPTITGAAISVGGVTLGATAPAFTITLNGAGGAASLSFEGAGVTNNSVVPQQFFVATGAAGQAANFIFNNASSAGAKTTWTLNNNAAAIFTGTATGGTASFVVNAGGSLDISQSTAAGVAVGSIAGGGVFSLGSKDLTTGGNNATTAVSGLIRDGGIVGAGCGGRIDEDGNGCADAVGRRNTYTGGTTLDNGGPGGRITITRSAAGR